MSEEANPVSSEQNNSQDSFTFGEGLHLTITPDGLIASLELSFEKAPFYTRASLARYLSENNVIHGIDLDAVGAILETGRFNESVTVAHGAPPQHGKDGNVKWEVDISVLDGAALIEKKGKVDWKEQHHVLQVNNEQLLATLIPPTEGIPGKDVLGKEIAATNGKPVKLPAGKGVRISEDGSSMYAAMNGAVSKNGDKYTVSQTFEVRGDINFESGNVEYEGTVIINGGVLSDFKVKSGQDIHINGLVEGALLEANGSIFINGGIQGDQKAKLIAGGDINAKYVNNATLQAMGNIVIHSAITQSAVQSHSRVIVEGPKGTISGGSVYAEHEISADVYGAEIGTKTIVVLGNDLREFKIKLKQHEKKLQVIVENAKKLDHALAQLNKLHESGKMTPPYEEMRLKLIRAAMQQKGQVKTAQATADAMNEEFSTARKQQKGIIVRDTAWAGTTIQIMDETYNIPKQASKVIFAMPGDTIKEFGYKIQDGKESATAKN